jgi:hydroxymethylpyrimidine/phosphomethylpyrimidine kinase
MKKYIAVLSIAGSDSGGGAGIQADLKTFSALGCYGTTAITAVTVQNTMGVSDIHPVPVAIIQGQIEAVMQDVAPQAIKIGMVNRPEVVEMLEEVLKNYPDIPIVFDPVMVASSGDRLIENETIELLKEHLFPLSTLLTPNLEEAAIILGHPILNPQEMQLAAKKIQNMGVANVLLKGGHLKGNQLYDVLCEEDDQLHLLRCDRIITHNTHGTGCTLSSAVACELAKGHSLYQAVARARRFIQQALIDGKDVSTGKGHGPLNHFFNPQKMIINELE